jgi:hypothetical protein
MPTIITPKTTRDEIYQDTSYINDLRVGVFGFMVKGKLTLNKDRIRPKNYFSTDIIKSGYR